MYDPTAANLWVEGAQAFNQSGRLMMTRVTRMFALVAIAAFCLCAMHCSSGDSVEALSVDNPNTAADLGVPVGTTIQLTCIAASPPSQGHILSCSCLHQHGAISVAILAATSGDTDQFDCGHGCIITTSSPDVTC